MTTKETEIKQLMAESLLPAAFSLLGPSRKPIGVKAIILLESRGLRVQSIQGSSTGVITFKDEKKGFVFVKLNPAAKRRAPVWHKTVKP